MIKRVVALVIMAMLFSFNCEKGCGAAKKEEVKEQPAAEQPAEGAAAEGAEKTEGAKTEEHK